MASQYHLNVLLNGEQHEKLRTISFVTKQSIGKIIRFLINKIDVKDFPDNFIFQDENEE